LSLTENNHSIVSTEEEMLNLIKLRETNEEGLKRLTINITLRIIEPIIKIYDSLGVDPSKTVKVGNFKYNIERGSGWGNKIDINISWSEFIVGKVRRRFIKKERENFVNLRIRPGNIDLSSYSVLYLDNEEELNIFVFERLIDLIKNVNFYKLWQVELKETNEQQTNLSTTLKKLEDQLSNEEMKNESQ
jgi:hypothetical protein